MIAWEKKSKERETAEARQKRIAPMTASAQASVPGSIGVQPTSELLCLLSMHSPATLHKAVMQRYDVPTTRADLQRKGVQALVALAAEMIDMSFAHFVDGYDVGCDFVGVSGGHMFSN